MKIYTVILFFFLVSALVFLEIKKMYLVELFTNYKSFYLIISVSFKLKKSKNVFYALFDCKV